MKRKIEEMHYKNLWVAVFSLDGRPIWKEYTRFLDYAVLSKAVCIGTGKEIEKRYL